MCTRYYIDSESGPLLPYVQAVGRSSIARTFIEQGSPIITSGEVRPCDVAPVLATSRRRTKTVFPMKWGFQIPGRSLLVNARVETAAEKPTFKEAWEKVISGAQDLCDYLPPITARSFQAEINKAKTQKINLKLLSEFMDIVSNFRKVSDESEGKTIEVFETADRSVGKMYAVEQGFHTYKEYEKRIEVLASLEASHCEECKNIISEANWLYEKFGEGEYRDVAGLCKIADLEEIKSKGWSLTPGAYVGVPPTEDDGVDFTERMKEIHQELEQLQAESNDLMKAISENLKEMGL